MALETAVQADMPDRKKVSMHANALLKHFRMMKMMMGGGKKMTMKKKMVVKKKRPMKTKTTMEMNPM